MSRLDTTNVLATKMGGGHMESVVGRETTGGDDKAVQVGEFGTIGALIKDNVYEFLPLAAATDKLYVIATPEVNYRDEDITDRVIKNFVLEDGAVVDAVPLVVGDKISISEDGIEGVTGSVAETGYAYTKASKRKLQYSATKPTTGDELAIFKIEAITPNSQNIVVGLGGKALNLSYNMVKLRLL